MLPHLSLFIMFLSCSVMFGLLVLSCLLDVLSCTVWLFVMCTLPVLYLLDSHGISTSVQTLGRLCY